MTHSLQPTTNEIFLLTGLAVANNIKRSIRSALNMSNQSSVPGPIAIAITESITENLEPIHLEVINESYMHNVPKGAETHFKVLVVCFDCFSHNQI